MTTKLIKYLFLIMLSLLIFCGFSQNPKGSYYQEGILYDASNRPLLGDSSGYFTLRGDTIYPFNPIQNISYVGGREAFEHFIDSCYYNNPRYRDTIPEMNYYLRFFIIFNDNFKIEEVRIVRPPYELYEQYNVDEYLIDCIRINTQNRWMKSGQNQKWYIYGQGYRLK